MDDTLFIWSAKQIQTNPADFYGFSANWYGWDMPMAEITKNPPATCYYIALAASLFGWSEVVMHVAFLIPAVMAALGVYYLARKFCSQPVIAALAAVLSPGFLVSSTNIMCDTMMLAFWVWAIFFWVRGIEANSYSNLLFAVVLAAICALTKYFGMALLPLLFVYSLMQNRKLGVWVLFLVVPVVILAGYQWMTHSFYGRGLLWDAAAYATEYSWAQVSKLLPKGLTGLLFAGGCIITALFYSPLLWSRRILVSSIVLTILFILILSFVEKVGEFSVKDGGNIRWNILIQIGLMAITGVNILALAGVDFWKCRNAESLLLLLWVFGTFIFASFINWTVNARSILPIAPAVGILLMRRIDQYNDKAGRRIRMRLAAWLLVPAAVAALLVCWADYTLAGTARSAAAAIHRTFGSNGHVVWFQGHWGFQYYMEAAGGKAIDFKNSELAEADIIIIPSNNTNTILPQEERASLSEVFQFTPYRKLATMNLQLGAGFYANMLGPLPFVAGSVGPEEYYAFIVK